MRSKNVFFHLTDFCNQNCSFCFAREEMTRIDKKQINLEDFKKICIKLKKLNVLKLDFLGGEPTLHPQFTDILKYTLKHFFYVRIYTNGSFSKKIRDTVANYPGRLTLIVNISTPDFVFNKEVGRLVLDNIDYLASKIPITLSAISLFVNQSIIDNFKKIPKKILKKTIIKLNFMTPIAHDKNLITIDDFPKVGKNLINVIKRLEKIYPHLQFRFNKMFRPCMFKPEDISFLIKRRIGFITKNTTCHNNDNTEDLFHITSDLSTFKCYPLSTIDVFNIKDELSIGSIKKKYTVLHKKYCSELILPKCRECSFFGFGRGKCSGPCIAFRINALKNDAYKKI